MDLKAKRINWMGNIYRKFEAVCQEVDDIVGQDAVKYLENGVQNVGDSVKKLYSGVVQELLPFPTLVSTTKYEAYSDALKNHFDSSLKSVGCGDDNNKSSNGKNPINNFIEKLQDSNAINPANSNDQQAGAPNSVKSVRSGEDNNKNGDKENPINNFIEALQDSTAINLADDQQAGAPDKDELVNQLSVEICSVTQKVVGGDSRETFMVRKENLHSSIEESSFKSGPELNNLISVKEKEPLEFAMHSEFHSGSLDSTCKVSLRTKDNKEVNLEQNSLFIVGENSNNLSAAQVLNITSLDEKEAIKASLFCESCKRLITKTGPLCIKSSLIYDGSYSRSLGRYSFEIESCKSNSGDVAWCISDSSIVHVCCEFAQVAGQVMEFHDGLVASCCCQSMESNAESTVHSIESHLEDIQLNDDTKLEENCVFVDDRELYAASLRAQKHRSYKKRIQDAFTSNKRLAKEYEQLGIWYGDTDMEPSQDLPPRPLPFRSRTYADLKHLQMQQASETEWELL